MFSIMDENCPCAPMINNPFSSFETPLFPDYSAIQSLAKNLKNISRKRMDIVRLLRVEGVFVRI